MNHLMNITKKELREIMTPGSIASILFVVVMFVVLGNAMSSEAEESSEPADICIVYYGDPLTVLDLSVNDITVKDAVYAAYTASYGVTDPANISEHVTVIDSPSADWDGASIIHMIEEKGAKFAVAVDVAALESNVESSPRVQTVVPVFYVYESGGLFDSATDSAGSRFVDALSAAISSADLGDGYAPTIAPVTTGTTYTDVDGKVYSEITPYDISSALMGQKIMIPIVVMIVIMMVGSVVISSMGSEKENKTLETLLTMPIKRTTIVSGKLLAAALMGLFYGVCYMLGMMFYTDGLTSGAASLNLSDYGLGMEPADWAVLLALMFLSIFSALGICMILGAFTKNYKMAQTMTMPISLLALIPMFVFMFFGWGKLPLAIKALMFANPFSHPMMALDNLMFGDLGLVAAGAVYLLAFDAVMIYLTVRIYNSDVLITGLEGTKFVKNMKRIMGLKEKDNGQ